MAPNVSQQPAQAGGLQHYNEGAHVSPSELFALQLNLTAALKRLAVDEVNRQAIAGGIPLLLQQLSQGSAPAAEALQVRTKPPVLDFAVTVYTFLLYKQSSDIVSNSILQLTYNQCLKCAHAEQVPPAAQQNVGTGGAVHLKVPLKGYRRLLIQ